MTLYLLILMAFLTHIGFAGSRLTVPLFAVDQGGGPFVAGTIAALYAALPALLESIVTCNNSFKSNSCLISCRAAT